MLILTLAGGKMDCKGVHLLQSRHDANAGRLRMSNLIILQDLEVQNNELVEANEKLQKEMSMLRSLAKEAILEKKKSQAALEALKHQVVHLLGDHNRLAKQGTLKQDPAAQPSTGLLPVSLWTRFVLACTFWTTHCKQDCNIQPFEGCFFGPAHCGLASGNACPRMQAQLCCICFWFVQYWPWEASCLLFILQLSETLTSL